MTQVLVTGATGFVGHHLARHLVAQPELQVASLVRSSSRRDELTRLAVRTIEGDLTDAASLHGVCDGVDTVYHCACAVQDTFAQSKLSDADFNAVNVDGTLLLAREALRAGVRRFVHLSATAAMGAPEGPKVDEQSPCAPTTPYGRSKRAAEQGLLKLHAEQGLDVVILRPCLVVGTGKRNSELLRLFRLVRWGLFPFFGKGAPQRKPLVHVSDLVAAMELAADRGAAGSIFMITSGQAYPLERIVAEVAELVGVRRSHVSIPLDLAYVAALLLESLGRLAGFSPPLTRARLRLLTSDRELVVERARRELGYDPQRTDLRSLLREVYEEFVREGEL